jgi:cytochrome c oxidase assembly factor CtaG
LAAAFFAGAFFAAAFFAGAFFAVAITFLLDQVDKRTAAHRIVLDTKQLFTARSLPRRGAPVR